MEFLCYWVPYFDIDADYAGYIEKINPRDHYLSAAAECGSGIRILRQDLWEMIITFLISQQNNISRIRGCIDRLCKRYGEQKYSEEGVEYWTFPTAEQLGTATEEELAGETLPHVLLSQGKTGIDEAQRRGREGC